MAKRVSILIDENIDRKIRLIQAKQISKTKKSLSYSKALNDIVRKHLEKN